MNFSLPDFLRSGECQSCIVYQTLHLESFYKSEQCHASFRVPELRTITISRTVTSDRQRYTKNRLVIPLPKRVRSDKYHVLLDDDGRWGALYDGSTEPWVAHAALAPVSPVSAGVATVIGLLAAHKMRCLYLAIIGSVASHEYDPSMSDVDIKIVVKDSDVPKLMELKSKLPSNIDLFITGETDAKRLGRGLERQILLYANPLIDTLGLQANVRKKTINWSLVRERIAAEIDMLAAWRDMIGISTTKEERLACIPSVLLRLRTIYLADTMIRCQHPTKSGLFISLRGHGVSQQLLKRVYSLSREYDHHGLNTRYFDVIDQATLLRLWEAVSQYGQAVKRKVDQRAQANRET